MSKQSFGSLHSLRVEWASLRFMLSASRYRSSLRDWSECRQDSSVLVPTISWRRRSQRSSCYFRKHEYGESSKFYIHLTCFLSLFMILVQQSRVQMESKRVATFTACDHLQYDAFIQEITDILGFQWSTPDGLPPRDSPVCGFFHEFCKPPFEEGIYFLNFLLFNTICVVRADYTCISFLWSWQYILVFNFAFKLRFYEQTTFLHFTLHKHIFSNVVYWLINNGLVFR